MALGTSFIISAKVKCKNAVRLAKDSKQVLSKLLIGDKILHAQECSSLQPSNKIKHVGKLWLDNKNFLMWVGAPSCKANTFKTNKVTTKLLMLLLIHTLQQTQFLIQQRCYKEQSRFLLPVPAMSLPSHCWGV